MNIALNINQYDINNIYYCDSIKNNVVSDGMFIRLIYSTDYFVTNGINISVSFNDVTIDKYYNKYKCTFNVNNNRNNIESIYHIEKEILDKINTKNKIIQTKISDQLKNGNFKIFSENVDKPSSVQLFILKISGIWETDNYIGLTFKFCKINQC
jgi:phage-related tail protein